MLYDASPSIVTCVLALVVPAFVTWVLRCSVRISRNAWGLDDTFMALAAPFFAWLSASCLSAAWNGIGTKDAHLTGGVAQQTRALKDFFLFEISYCVTVLLVKLSIAMTLMRIAGGKPLYQWIIRGTIALFSTVIVMVCLYILLECQPIQYAWDKSLDGKCKPAKILTAMSFTLSSTNILTDWTCALLPVPLLWSLEMNRNSKIAAGVLLSFGIFASACALVRLQYTIGLTATSDYLYHVSYVLLWAYAEVGVGMTAANCSTLRPVFSKILHLSSLGGSSGDRSRDQSKNGGGWLFSRSSRRSRGGAIELDDSEHPGMPSRDGDDEEERHRKGARVHAHVEAASGSSRDRSNTRTVGEESSLEDDESARKILGASGRMGMGSEVRKK
ncbi:hypothetical protein UCRNP2_8462 [Neofusicoccum parvum UCRNP2]|uniref:Rhodopsin domain-containing protein n=1 Tax=Botryosphaeria parva (strain UCR-NP2) TaxID=1287680 RepID=R1EBG4_BOTPV|nr:hypothetical protein UCRNP2_8462 [Neofusicoccum parvum UCRNP2]